MRLDKYLRRERRFFGLFFTSTTKPGKFKTKSILRWLRIIYKVYNFEKEEGNPQISPSSVLIIKVYLKPETLEMRSFLIIIIVVESSLKSFYKIE